MPGAPKSWRILDKVQEHLTLANTFGVLGALLALACLFYFPPAVSIRVLLYAIVYIWTFLRPRMALYLTPFAVAWGSLDALTVAGISLTSADILVLLLFASWLCSHVIRPRMGSNRPQAGPFDRTGYNLPRILSIGLLALLLAMLVSIPTALSFKTSLKEIAKWLEVAILLCLGSQYLRTRQQVWTLVIMCILAGISQAFMGYAQYMFDLGPQSFVRGSGLRIYGTFNQPNPYAGFIDMALLITISLTLLGRNWATRILAGGATILLGAAFVLSQSRGANIALALALVFLCIVGFPRLNVLVRLGVIVLLLLFAAYCANLIPEHYVTPILHKLGLAGISFVNPHDEDFSTAERLAHWIAGINMFLDHPLLGVGIGNYPNAYPRYFITIFANPLGHAHNYYINIAAEAGIFGFAGLFTFLFSIFLTGKRVLHILNKRIRIAKKEVYPTQVRTGAESFEQRRTLYLASLLSNDRALAIGLIASLLAICLHNLFDDLYVHNMTNLFALLIILLTRLPDITLKQ
ncbi:hypothetical protein KSX_11870 [Ktedonospora formicarum]|uniref:O-antigen ligase-related domain-containing protein n=1 Tax=Ktedonospora formicarum TaxID=2778364 RepID=A0A8J3HZY6_9CHLR|nr:hypothetical protein KSX_11870 [Ktedonospora formicarum]